MWADRNVASGVERSGRMSCLPLIMCCPDGSWIANDIPSGQIE